MRFRAAASLVLFALVGCGGPNVVPSSQDKSFKLFDLTTHRIAVLPVATADLDQSTSETVAEEYQSKDKFLDAFSTKLSLRLLGIAKAPSLGSDRMQALLMGSESTRALLDPAHLLGAQDPNNRFSGGPNANGIASLSQLPELQGVRFAIVIRDLSIGRQWSNHTSAGGGFVSAGPGGGAFVGGGTSSSAKTSARLRLAVVDLESRSIVWDGAVYDSESSTLMKKTALHEIEEGLGVHLVNEILGIR